MVFFLLVLRPNFPISAPAHLTLDFVTPIILNHMCRSRRRLIFSFMQPSLASSIYNKIQYKQLVITHFYVLLGFMQYGQPL